MSWRWRCYTPLIELFPVFAASTPFKAWYVWCSIGSAQKDLPPEWWSSQVFQVSPVWWCPALKLWIGFKDSMILWRRLILKKTFSRSSIQVVGLSSSDFKFGLWSQWTLFFLEEAPGWYCADGKILLDSFWFENHRLKILRLPAFRRWFMQSEASLSDSWDRIISPLASSLWCSSHLIIWELPSTKLILFRNEEPCTWIQLRTSYLHKVIVQFLFSITSACIFEILITAGVFSALVIFQRLSHVWLIRIKTSSLLYQLFV